MAFSSEQGLIPLSIKDLYNLLILEYNAKFQTSYTYETFEGTDAYKYFYPIIQRVQQNEVKASEIFQKLALYIAVTNERILRPKTTPEGTIDALAEAGFIASVKPPIVEDAGLKYVCVDVDDTAPNYAEKKLQICNLLKDYTVGGVVTMGTEEEDLRLSNGQEFPFRFYLPDRKTTLLRLTLTTSRNNQFVIETNEVVAARLLANVQAMYRLGLDFEPEKYFSTSDAPWASDILLEYSFDDGDNWSSSVYEAEFDELIEVSLDDIEIIET